LEIKNRADGGFIRAGSEGPGEALFMAQAALASSAGVGQL